MGGLNNRPNAIKKINKLENGTEKNHSIQLR